MTSAETNVLHEKIAHLERQQDNMIRWMKFGLGGVLSLGVGIAGLIIAGLITAGQYTERVDTASRELGDLVIEVKEVRLEVATLRAQQTTRGSLTLGR